MYIYLYNANEIPTITSFLNYQTLYRVALIESSSYLLPPYQPHCHTTRRRRRLSLQSLQLLYNWLSSVISTIVEQSPHIYPITRPINHPSSLSHCPCCPPPWISFFGLLYLTPTIGCRWPFATISSPHVSFLFLSCYFIFCFFDPFPCRQVSPPMPYHVVY